MFLNSSSTPLDLRFRLAGFPVRVSPWFWLTMFLLGGETYLNPDYGFLASLVWVLCGFITILVHELGHGFMARQYRCYGHIDLVPFGGALVYDDRPPSAGWRQLAVSLAGPFLGFAFVVLLVATEASAGWTRYHGLLQLAFSFLLIQGYFWNLLNLIPLWPLDGGRALREILFLLRFRQPDLLTHWAAILLAAYLVLIGFVGRTNPDHPLIPVMPYVVFELFFVAGRWLVLWIPFVPSLFMVVWFGLIGFMNYQMLQYHQRLSRGWNDFDDGPSWSRGR